MFFCFENCTISVTVWARSVLVEELLKSNLVGNNRETNSYALPLQHHQQEQRILESLVQKRKTRYG